MEFDTSRAHPLFELIRKLSGNFTRCAVSFKTSEKIIFDIQIFSVDNQPVLEMKVSGIDIEGKKVRGLDENFVFYPDGNVDVEVIAAVRSKILEKQYYLTKLNTYSMLVSPKNKDYQQVRMKVMLDRICSLLTSADTCEIIPGNPLTEMTESSRATLTLTHEEMGFEDHYLHPDDDFYRNRKITKETIVH